MEREKEDMVAVLEENHDDDESVLRTSTTTASRKRPRPTTTGRRTPSSLPRTVFCSRTDGKVSYGAVFSLRATLGVSLSVVRTSLLNVSLVYTLLALLEYSAGPARVGTGRG
jgi:hypothetical protein